MGRSRLQRKVARADEYPGNGSEFLSSFSSEIRWSDGNPNGQKQVQINSSALESSLDALYEKRAATREAGLKGLVRALSREVLLSYVGNKYETLAHQLHACMTKGGSSEIALAARALGLLVLTLGVGDATLRVKGDVELSLMKVASRASSSIARIAALDAIAIITFVCNVGQDTEAAMAFLWQIISHSGDECTKQKLSVKSPPEAVKAAALTGWTLLLSTLPAYLVSEVHFLSSLPLLSSFLQSHNLVVRRAAGEAAATLYEAIHDDTQDDSDAFAGDVELGEDLYKDSENHVEMIKEQVLDQMKILSVTSSKKWQTREERARQRKSFRQLLTTLDDGVPRELKLKIPKCKVLIIKTWSETVQLNAVKQYVGEGFPAHMQGNPLLHEIFDVELEEARVHVSSLRLTSIEKRMLFSPNSSASKARTKLMNRTRLSNQAGKAAQYNINGWESD